MVAVQNMPDIVCQSPQLLDQKAGLHIINYTSQNAKRFLISLHFFEKNVAKPRQKSTRSSYAVDTTDTGDFKTCSKPHQPANQAATVCLIVDAPISNDSYSRKGAH
jgi:hypothetical protein